MQCGNDVSLSWCGDRTLFAIWEGQRDAHLLTLRRWRTGGGGAGEGEGGGGGCWGVVLEVVVVRADLGGDDGGGWFGGFGGGGLLGHFVMVGMN